MAKNRLSKNGILQVALVFSGILFYSLSVFSQSKMSVGIQKLLVERSSQWVDILVVGTERVNLDKDNRSFPNTNSNQRITSKLHALHQNLAFENSWLNELKKQEVDYLVIHQFWSMNLVAIRIPVSALLVLEANPEVYWMELLHERQVTYFKPEKISSYTRSVNGVEPGIPAIKANELWQLGYSGKGTKLLTFDTGIWPSHPSFRQQFLGFHVPLSEAWFGFDTYFPGDKPDAHGTHVTGTCLGLDPATNDTIGIAYNAYFMATDPIVESLSELKSIYEIFRGYEWALNPDGDTNTTADMPNVINNSWGRPVQPGDSVMCDGWVNDMMITLEAVGIVSIHSAGNSGPGASTVSFPGSSNPSLVNCFTVGAVNGNSSSFTIANFSSRGPSICADTGALLIKPEVVAPGVNVRSSVREDDNSYTYANYQGTSMASPHVSGVALLLIEAFPMATAKEIKEALYYSANDLGPAGEDNAYGRGMVNALDAFNYLTQIYTPVPPQNGGFDVKITGFDLPQLGQTCSQSQVKLFLETNQTVPLSNCQIEYGIVGETPLFKSFSSGTLQNNDTLMVNFSNWKKGHWNQFYAKLVYTGALEDADSINNAYFTHVFVTKEVDLPFAENFNNKHPFESAMYVENKDERISWDSLTVPGRNGFTTAARMRYARYSPRAQQQDALISPNLNVETNTQLTLQFDVSYQLRFSGFADSVLVMVSTDCGNTWDSPVYAKGPVELNSTSSTGQPNWVPADSSDWRTETVDLSAYANQNQIMVKIVGVNGGGNNLYVDNVSIYGDDGPVSTNNRPTPTLTIFPNPAKNTVHFSMPISGQLYSLTGTRVEEFKNCTQLDVGKLPVGVYVIVNSLTQEKYKVVINR